MPKRLEAPQMLDSVDEFGDGVTLQILTVFPGFVLQQIMNCLAVRQVLPKGPGRTELVWTAFGYASDDDEMRSRRLRQANLMGPAGFVSVDDSEVMDLAQRGIQVDPEGSAMVEMGGRGTEDHDHIVTETAIRAFYSYYRDVMGL